MRHKGYRLRVLLEQVVAVETGDRTPGNHEDERVLEHEARTYPVNDVEFSAVLEDPLAAAFDIAAHDAAPKLGEDLSMDDAARARREAQRLKERAERLRHPREGAAESARAFEALGRLDELDWSFIWAAVGGPLSEGAAAMFREDAHAAQTRVYSRLDPVVRALCTSSPLRLRLGLLAYGAPPGTRYGPTVGTCYSQGGEPKTTCGLPIAEDGSHFHSWESRLALWRCERGHVIEQVMGEPSKCKLDGCEAKFFIPLSPSAKQAWMDARDPTKAETTEFRAVRP